MMKLQTFLNYTQSGLYPPFPDIPFGIFVSNTATRKQRSRTHENKNHEELQDAVNELHRKLDKLSGKQEDTVS